MIRPLVVVIGAACFAMPAVAVAKPKVIVVKIEGDASGDVFTAVTESLDSDVALVGQKEVNKQVDKLNLSDDLTDKEVGKLEKALGAEALIRGNLDKKGETMALHLKVYVKATAKPKAFTVKFSNAGSEKFRKSLHDTILDKIGATADAGDDTPPDDPPKKPKKKPKKPVAAPADDGGDDATPAADPPKKPKKKPKKPAPTDDGGDDATAPDDGGDDAAAPPKKPKKKKVATEDGDDATAGESDEIVVVAPGRMTSRDAIRFDAGLSFTGRSLTFASRSFDQAPKAFKNAPVPGAHVEAEMYPFAFANPKSAGAGFGFAFEYDRTLSLTLRTTAADGTVVSAKAAQQNYQVAAVYRIPFGSSATAPSVTLGIGYGQRAFIVSRGGLMDPNSIDIPDINYVAFIPRASIRIPFSANVALSAGADLPLVTDAGPIEKQDSYGQGKVTGAEGYGALDIILSNRFIIRLEGDVAAFGFAFVGNGAMAINRDGDPTTKDVGGAKDIYYGGAATLGVLY